MGLTQWFWYLVWPEACTFSAGSLCRETLAYEVSLAGEGPVAQAPLSGCSGVMVSTSQTTVANDYSRSSSQPPYDHLCSLA